MSEIAGADDDASGAVETTCDEAGDRAEFLSNHDTDQLTSGQSSNAIVSGSLTRLG